MKDIQQSSSLADHLHNGGRLPAGIRRVSDSADNPPTASRMPVGQQQMESHVLVPLIWAIVPSLILAAMVTAVAWRNGYQDGLIPAVTFGVSFLMLYFKRTERADGLLWRIEDALDIDIDGDGVSGEPPYAPRSVTVTSGSRKTEIPMPPQAAGLTRSEWSEAAIALLHHRGRVSRRGIYDNSDLSQAKSADAASILLQRGYAADGELNGEGWDWLLLHLPDHITPRLDRPTDPPTPPNAG